MGDHADRTSRTGSPSAIEPARTTSAFSARRPPNRRPMSRRTSGSRSSVSGSTVVMGQRARRESSRTIRFPMWVCSPPAHARRVRRLRQSEDWAANGERLARRPRRLHRWRPGEAGCRIARPAPKLDPRIITGSTLDESQRFRDVLRIAIDKRLAVRGQRGAQAQQPIVPSRCADTFRSAHPDDTIARMPNVPILFSAGVRRRCLHRIAPYSRDMEAHAVVMPAEPRV